MEGVRHLALAHAVGQIHRCRLQLHRSFGRAIAGGDNQLLLLLAHRLDKVAGGLRPRLLLRLLIPGRVDVRHMLGRIGDVDLLLHSKF